MSTTLTHGDVQELTAFFNSPLTAGYRACISAQSYEPKGAGYQPATDTRLATLVLNGVRQGKSDWARMKRIVDHLSDVHVAVLHLAATGGVASIATRLPSALAAGRKLAADEARAETLQRVSGEHDGASPMTIAMRVLEADRRFTFDARQLSSFALIGYARQAIEQGLVDVEAEATAIVAGAAAAYREAKALAGEWRRAVSQREDARRVEFRESLRAGREAKASERFARKLRGAA